MIYLAKKSVDTKHYLRHHKPQVVVIVLLQKFASIREKLAVDIDGNMIILFGMELKFNFILL